MSNVDSRRDGLTARHVLVVVTMSLMCFTSCCLPLSCAGVYYPSLVSYLGLSSTAALSVYQTFMSVTMIVVLPRGRSLRRLTRASSFPRRLRS